MGVLVDLAERMILDRCAGTVSDGTTVDLTLMTSRHLNNRTQHWRTSFALSLRLQMLVDGLVFLLWMQENPSVLPSSNPLLSLVGTLSECPVLEAQYAMQHWLACTSLGHTWKGTLQTFPTWCRIINKNDVSDSLVLRNINL